MKLDSIIYDANTLASVLTQKLQEESPTFKALYPSDTGSALINLLAGFGSMLQYSLVSALANCYTDSVFSPDGVYQLAETLGNRLQGNTSSQITCSITRNNVTGSEIVIPINSVFDVDGVKFFNKTAIRFPLNVLTVNGVVLIQGEHVKIEKTTSGIAGEKIYFSENFKCDLTQVTVRVNNEEWYTTETFLPLNSNNISDIEEAKTVILRMTPDGRAYIKFGNNTNGILPAAGSTVTIEYVSNEGAAGNIENNNSIITLETPLYFSETGSSSQVRLDTTCLPLSTASGGHNTQDLQTLKETSPFVFASGNRAVRREDYKAMFLNKCGYLSCNVWGEYEESNYYGYYSLAMMNTVYYTGVKSLQIYNNINMGDISIDDGLATNEERALDPITFIGYMGALRGFPGSYSVDIIYSENSSISMNLSDKFGNGILTYDPSSNAKNQNEDLYPYNDLKEDYIKSTEDPNTSPLPVKITSPQKVKNISGAIMGDGEGLEFEGTDNNDFPMLINFDSPFQIEISFGEGVQHAKSIAAFQFQAPSGKTTGSNSKEKLPHYIGTFAVYATKNAKATMDNIKNDANWTKVVELQKIQGAKEDEWTDWYTTNLYQPGKTSNPSGWESYTRYVIEIYSQMDESANYAESEIFIQQIKAIYSDYTMEVEEVVRDISTQEETTRIAEKTRKVSTINYTSNNAVSLCIPGLPEKMNYFKYNVDVSGITYLNGYRTGDIITYKYDANGANSVYYFNVRITNINSGAFMVYISKGSPGVDDNSGDNLTGKDKISLIEAPLTYQTIGSKYGNGNGAIINVESVPAIKVYGSAIGDAYDKEVIEAADQPIIDKYNHFTTYIEFKQPRIKNAQISLTVEYEDNSTYAETKKSIVEAVHKIFELTPYYVGKDLNVSDIWQAVNSVKGVKRFIVNTPTENVRCEPFELIMLPENNLIITDILNPTLK